VPTVRPDPALAEGRGEASAMTVQLCPACQQPLRRARSLCRCGHPITSHEITRSGARTWCAHYSPEGPCPCQAFTTQDHPSTKSGAAQEGNPCD
jgi:hypothetical protein